MSISNVALRVGEDQSFSEAASFGQTNYLEEYISSPALYNTGDVLLAPTYRLEEVEEIIEPEKPGVPVEPYVGLSWACSFGCRHFVISVQGSCYEVISETEKGAVFLVSIVRIGDYRWENYPHTPSTPAVTRKVKKWVKIDHPEAICASHPPSPEVPEWLVPSLLS